MQRNQRIIWFVALEEPCNITTTKGDEAIKEGTPHKNARNFLLKSEGGSWAFQWFVHNGHAQSVSSYQVTLGTSLQVCQHYKAL